MDKILEFLDFLILATRGGLRWDFIKPEPTTDNKESYYRVLNPESKTDLITLIQEGDNLFLKLIGKESNLSISSKHFFSVEVENRLKELYDEVRLSSLLSEDKLKTISEEFDRVILMLG